jgi:hypothetical protein
MVEKHADSLACSNDPSKHFLAKQIKDALRVVPWKINSWSLGTIDRLTHFFMPKKWLSTEHGDALLRVLCTHLGVNSSVKLLESHYLRCVFDYYKAKEPLQAWVVDAAVDALQNLHAIGTFINKDGKHFLPLYIDVTTRLVLWGDSLGGDAPPEGLLASINSWFQAADPHVPFEQFTLGSLSVGEQKDFCNCLLFSIDALKAKIAKKPPMQPGDAAGARIQAFLDIVHHNVSRYFLVMFYHAQ